MNAAAVEIKQNVIFTQKKDKLQVRKIAHFAEARLKWFRVNTRTITDRCGIIQHVKNHLASEETRRGDSKHRKKQSEHGIKRYKEKKE